MAISNSMRARCCDCDIKLDYEIGSIAWEERSIDICESCEAKRARSSQSPRHQSEGGFVSRYFTAEFLCDDLEVASKLCKELQDKYDIACRKNTGARISSWRDGAMEEEHSDYLREIHVSSLEINRKDALIAELVGALIEYACKKDCWADSISGPNPLIGEPNKPFCHNEMRGRECGKIARDALSTAANLGYGKE